MAHSQAAPAPAPPAGTLRLPILVFGIVEVRRLKRELEALEEFMIQAGLREPGKQPSLPRVSRLLDALATENHLNLLQPEDRQRMKAFLERTEQHAPTVHMSFATDPSSAFIAKIVTWMRSSLGPDALLEIGLQPTIAAGAILRTNNKVFDLSLREHFAKSTELMLQAFEKEAGDITAVVAQPAPAETPQPAPVAVVQPVTAPAMQPAQAAPQVAPVAAAPQAPGSVPAGTGVAA